VNRIALSIFIALVIPLQAFSQHRLVTYRVPVELPANTPDGGRANTVLVSPWSPNELFVASDSGGLFKSTDWGVRWAHVDSLPVSDTQSIAYLDADTLLVSAKADHKLVNGGGVWRTDDGGVIWTQVPLTVPGFTGRLSAYGISVEGNSVAVATSEGVFTSTDRGATWTFSNPFSIQPGPVYSVLVNAGRIFAGGPRGVRINTMPLGEWSWPANGIVGAVRSIHAFEPSPLTGFHAYVAAGGSFFLTIDRGLNWWSVPGAPPQDGVCGGAAFVEAARRNNVIELYFGTTCGLHRFTAPIEGTTVRYDLGVRRQLEIERSDRPRDLLLFNADPVLLATNGGIQDTADGGLHWRFAAGGRDGYNAVQVAELKGQFITSVDHIDLHAATRDNHFWSADVDANIDASLPVETFFVEAERRLFLETDTRVTWAKCNPCETRKAGWQFGGEEPWSDPPQGMGAPVLIRGDRYVQPVRSGLSLTANAGDDWQPFAAFFEETRGMPRLARAGAGDHAIVYQTFRANLSGPPSEGATRLLRVDFSQGNGVVVYPAMAGFGGLGISRTSAAMYPVYGVDSRNAFHVIAPDIINGKMMETWNGGEEWDEIPGLTKLVTNDGKFLFHTDLPDAEAAPLVTAVSFSPDDPSLVLIGTREGGIYMSGDRGKTWSRITNSERVPYVTSFFWENANTVYLSTYGRGLWKLQNTQFAVQDMFDVLCSTCDVVAQFDASVLVFDGRILGTRTEKGQLREVFVTQGSSVVFTGDPKNPQEDIAITRSNGKETGEPLPKGPDGWIATGVVFTSDGSLTGAAFAKSELSLLPPEFEGSYKGSTDSPMKGRPYVRVTSSAFNGVATVAPLEVFAVSGTNLAANASYEVLVDGVAVPGKVTADGNGSLTARLSAPSESGYHRVDVRTAGDGAAIDGSVFLVTQAN
jgi:photosystem II stability/assembly factor-like uncharacterized protein